MEVPLNVFLVKENGKFRGGTRNQGTDVEVKEYEDGWFVGTLNKRGARYIKILENIFLLIIKCRFGFRKISLILFFFFSFQL